MDDLLKALHYEIWILLAGLAALVAYQLLTHRVSTSGLLHDKSSRRQGSPGRLSPGRIQLFVFTVGVALYYLLQVFGAERPGEFPAIRRELLLMLAASHSFYLGGKLFPLLTQALAARRDERKPTT